MKLIKTISYSLLLLTTCIYAQNKVVYGYDDDRVDPTPNNPYYTISKSTAALIGEANFNTIINGKYDIPTKVTLEQAMNLCSNEQFLQQPVLASCSGALVAPNIIITAGHCVNGPTECGAGRWVFNYTKEAIKNFKIDTREVYRCQKVLKQQLDSENGNDYAVILLDRAVTGHTPLKYRKTGKISWDEDVVVIGHPTGLPTKIAAGAQVKLNDNPIFFTANLDTFGGNSGSAVFNQHTKEIEGILVRGATDYLWNDQRQCQEVNHCRDVDRRPGDYTCYGEDVTRITNIGLDDVITQITAEQREFFLAVQTESSLDKFFDLGLSANYTDKESQQTIYDLIVKKDNLELFKLIAQTVNFDINFANPQGQTPLQFTITQHAAKITEFLTSGMVRLRQEFHTINYDQQDQEGNTALHLAVLQRDLATIKRLLDRGANKTITNNSGKTPLALAQQLGLTAIIIALE